MSDNTKFGPPKGMRDWLPTETRLRQKLIRLIETHYQLYGFEPIDTPALENIEVLEGKGGGENEKLMFKVLKRGGQYLDLLKGLLKDKEKDWVAEEIENTITGFIVNSIDMGLRFDMTVPLARYYANHANDLPKPFRCSHIGPVWRADRPQRGRFREFYQCDIDIVGGASDAYEVELLLATDRVLKALGVGKFKIRISDKQLLTSVLRRIGTPVEKLPGVAVAIDKMDKLSFEDVQNEIKELGLDPENFEKIVLFLNSAKSGFLDLELFKEVKITEIGKKIQSIRDRVKAVNPDANVVFDPLLVRGFDYYTGPVFEINVEDKDFSFSIGGGGRYDGLIEKLGGPKDTPAVGLSLGFERILLIRQEKEKSTGKDYFPGVFIVNGGQPEKDLQLFAEKQRSFGIPVAVGIEKKDLVKQLKAAEENGFEYAITEFDLNTNLFKVRQLSTRQDTQMSSIQLLETIRNITRVL